MVLAAAEACLQFANHPVCILHPQIGAIDALPMQGAIKQASRVGLHLHRKSCLEAVQAFKGSRVLTKTRLPRRVDIEVLGPWAQRGDHFLGVVEQVAVALFAFA